MSLELVRSGVPAIDETLGGIVARHITLVTGAVDSGKTCLTLGYVCAALRRREPSCFITTDSPEAILDFADLHLGQDLRPHLRKKLFTLLSFGPNFESKVRSMGAVEKPFGELAALVKDRGVEHLVIDTIDPVLASAAEIASIKPYIQGLVEEILALQVTAVCTLIGGGSHMMNVAAEELASAASSSLELHREGPGRSLFIREALWSQRSGQSFPVDLIEGAGIVPSMGFRREAAPAAAQGTSPGVAPDGEALPRPRFTPNPEAAAKLVPRGPREIDAAGPAAESAPSPRARPGSGSYRHIGNAIVDDLAQGPQLGFRLRTPNPDDGSETP